MALAPAHEFHHADGWLELPDGQEHLGDSHGEIDVDSAGLVYVSVAGGEKPGIQVYSADGEYLRNVPNARPNHHGFTIHRENDADVIYAACLGGETAALKLSLDGEILLEIPGNAIPEAANGGKLALTDIDVGPDGRIYLIDGYASDKIFVFDETGAYQETFAGKGQPTGFKNAHKFAIDARFEPARLLVCDRGNNRLVHLDLDGGVIGDFATGLRRPSAVDFHGDLVAVAEIDGRVSLLDKDGESVAVLGDNEDPKLRNTNRVEPADWEPGVTTAPHGITFTRDGAVITTEWNTRGRVLRWDHQHE